VAQQPPHLTSTGAAGRSVLVVDDDHDIRDTLQAILEQEGYRASTARNGREALARAREERPGVILLDLFMPGMDGARFLRQKQRDPELAPIPVFVISAAADVRERVADLPVAGYLDKPLEIDRVLRVVARFCR
jgi:CheY-like chemotaxis protein